MGKYGYKGVFGGWLTVSDAAGGVGAYLLTTRDGLTVTNGDAPKVAAEILKAAGVPGVFIGGELPGNLYRSTIGNSWRRW